MKNSDLELVCTHLKQVVLDYCEYSGISYKDVVKLINKGSELARDEWNHFVKMGSDEEIFEFYNRSKYYIYEVMQPYLEPKKYNKDVNYLRIIKFAENIIKNKGSCRALDFGGGVGVLCILLAKANCEVTYADLPGVISEFAGWRFNKHGVKIQQLSSRIDGVDLPHNKYDLIVSDAVIEHLNRKYLGSFVQSFTNALVNRGYIYLLWDPTYTESYPYHILGMKTRELDKVMQKHSLIRISDYLYIKSTNVNTLVRHSLWKLKILSSKLVILPKIVV